MLYGDLWFVDDAFRPLAEAQRRQRLRGVLGRGRDSDYEARLRVATKRSTNFTYFGTGPNKSKLSSKCYRRVSKLCFSFNQNVASSSSALATIP